MKKENKPNIQVGQTLYLEEIDYRKDKLHKDVTVSKVGKKLKFNDIIRNI